jgi:hypothetical protein
MTNEILEAIQALEKAILQQATTDRKDNRFLETLGYYKRAKGVTTNRKEGSVGSKLHKKYAQQERTDGMFRGNMEEVKRLREEALSKTEAEREEELQQEVELTKSNEEAQDDDKQVLATSEKKTTRKRRNTRKKTDDK